MKKWMILLAVVAVVVLGIAGCSKLITTSEAKVEAAKRWNTTRAEMVYAVALEQFKAGQLDSAALEARKALSMDEKCLNARLLLGKVEIERGSNSAACAELKKAIAQAPQSAEAIYLLGVAQEKSGHLDDALASYRQAYQLDQSNLAPVSAAAEVLVRMGRTREAQLYVDSYARNAENEVGLFELGGRLAMMGNEYVKAVSYYQRALDLEAGNDFYRESLGKAQLIAGMYADAIDTLEPLVGRKGKEASPWVHAAIGDCYMALSKPALARDAYEQAGRRSKLSAGIRASLAKASLAEGNLPRAIWSARDALTLDGKCLEAKLVLGYALLLDGQTETALRELTQAAADHPDDGTLWCLLGRAHAANGDDAGAARCYLAAIRVDPDNALARELLNETQAKKLSRK
jgi:Flp pilus assembly protein TadD